MKKIIYLFFCLIVFFGTSIAQTTNVVGVVVSAEDGEALIGVTVVVKNTNMAAVTDASGKFSLNVPQGATSLNFSYIGYESVDMEIKPNMRVVMKSSSLALDEVVVTGMVATDKRLFTGATDKLGAGDVKIDGMTDISRALEGRSAGVSVQNISGTFGTAPKIRVRGATSIFGSSKPLWVVDGVIQENIVDVSSDDLSSGDAITLISSAIAGLNPDDIESFQILKDGSATSIYGAKAMAGVIVITTKKGQAGTARLSYTGEFTTRMKPRYSEFNIMNSQDQMGFYQELRDKGWLNFASVHRAPNSGVYGKMYQLMHHYDATSGQFGLPNSLYDPKTIQYLRDAEYRNTDWFDRLFSNSIMMSHSIGISSGTEKTQSYISISAMTDPGWTKQSEVQRYTANLNNTYNISKNLSFNAIANASYRKQKAPGTIAQNVDNVSGEVTRSFDINPYSYAMNTSRTLDPNLYYMRNYADFNIENELERNNISLNIVDLKFLGEFKWKNNKGLMFSLLGAVKYNSSSQEHKIHDYSNQAMAYRAMTDATIVGRNSWLYKDPDKPNELPTTILPVGGFYNKEQYQMFSYDFRLSGNYNKEINGMHIISAFGGMEINAQKRTNDWSNGYGMQYENGELPFFDYTAFKQMREKNTHYYNLTNTTDRQVAFFLTGTYSYKRRYTLTGVVRYEGSNRLGKSRSARWLPTWNISGGWNVHEESFFKILEPALSHLSVRASYSLTGESGPRWATNSRIVIGSKNPWRPSALLGESGLSLTALENADLTYEKKHELNVGADMGFLDNRFNLSFDVYKRNNFDLIGYTTTTGAGGELNRYGNVAELKSHGVEVSVTSTNIRQKDFGWTTSVIFGYSKEEVTKFDSREFMNRLVTGQGFTLPGYPTRALFSIPFKGLDDAGFPVFEIDGRTVDKTNYSSINFQDRENLDYLIYEGPTSPTITGSIGNILTYRNFRLNIFISYAAGNKIRLDPTFKRSYNDLDATPKEFKNRWMHPGDEAITNIPVVASTRDNNKYSNLNYGYNAYNSSTARVADGGFVRLKEVSLTYNLPRRLISLMHLNDASIKLQATNLFLLYADKKLNGQDPEFFRAGGVAVPSPKQFTLTLRVQF